MSARDVISDVAFEGTVLGAPIRFEMGHKKADAILSALDAAGYAVVPVEPTEEMLRAYYQCMEGTHPTARMNPDKYLTHNLKANTRWRAMLTAAKETP